MHAGQVIGNFKAVRRIGGGGMGEVWEARDVRLPRTVAIKSLPDQAGDPPEFLQRLEQEAHNLARLNHHGIVTLYDYHRDASGLYLVMELIQGETLEQRMRRQIGISYPQAMAWFLQVAQSLAYAHSQGVYHRDIKPSNIMLDTAGNTRLIDLGLALSEEQVRLTRSGHAVGTPPYMSPEQLQGNKADARSDIYALGLTMFHALTGVLPLRKPDGSNEYRGHKKIPRPLDGILRKCLQYNPKWRFQSASELAEAISAALGEEGEGFWAWLKRRGPWKTLAAVFLFLVNVPWIYDISMPGCNIWPASAPEGPPMVSVPGGAFIAGMDLSDVPAFLRDYQGVEKLTQGGRRQAEAGPFLIDLHEVTNAQYAEFVRDSGWSPPRHWNGAVPPAGMADHPVVNVSYKDADAYARWAGKRLPTADEWEKAARGEDGRVYPWGNEFVQGNTNTDEVPPEGTAAVTAFPGDKSPYGVMGLAGNVCEWTSTMESNDSGVSSRVICGGSWYESGSIVSIASFRRSAESDDLSRDDVGFRCAQDADAGNAGWPFRGCGR